MKSKIKNKKGFTLVEMIAAIAVLALMGVGLTAGLGAATKSYEAMMFSANSEVLEDSINTAFANTLRYASDVTTTNGVHFTSKDYPVTQLGGHVDCIEGRLMMCSDDSLQQTNWLLSDKTYTGYDVTDWSLTYSEGIFTATYKITDGRYTKEDCGFTYRNIEGSK
ncbi:MAG: prepilin-type N-terminal cleavage/methylation domain-containing protein [Eubacteriales bacterium]|nr:prepilin-type N-terminal cleavage/methylation domain-containing protein [Eubacteriales bacterium]